MPAAVPGRPWPDHPGWFPRGRNQLPVGARATREVRDPQLSTMLGHIGGFGGFRAALWHVPASGITITLSINQGATDPNTLAPTVLDTILAPEARVLLG